MIGAPRRDFGETLVGVRVAEESASLDLEEIPLAAGTSLARFKQPRKLIRFDELRRNSTGKVLTHIL